MAAAEWLTSGEAEERQWSLVGLGEEKVEISSTTCVAGGAADLAGRSQEESQAGLHRLDHDGLE